jgi:ABC-type dipeptide/oligopeptide/nickel transport system permease component
VDVLNEDYIRTARAKGLKERIVIVRHGLRNALIPAVTSLGLQFGRMLAGSVLVETVFSRPGLGSLVVHALEWQDYPLVQGTVLVIAVMYALANLVVDFAYALIDPRIRFT